MLMLTLMAQPLHGQSNGDTHFEGSFTELPLIVNGGEVYQIEFHNGLLYLAGSFNGGIAIYDPISQSTIVPDGGIEGTAHQFVRVGDLLYIVGVFEIAGDHSVSNIVSFDLNSGTFLAPLSGLSASEDLLSVTSDDGVIYTKHDAGVIAFTPTGTSYNNEIFPISSFFAPGSAIDPFLRTIVAGDYLVVGGNSIILSENPYYLYGRRIKGPAGSIVRGEFLPTIPDEMPEPEYRVRDIIRTSDNQILVLQDTGIISFFPGDTFEAGWAEPVIVDYIRATGPSARLLHKMDDFLFVLGVTGGNVRLSRQLFEGDPFRTNTDLSINSSFSNDTFSMTDHDGYLYIAGPIAGADGNQQVTLIKADLTSDLVDWSLSLRAIEGEQLERSLQIGTSPEATDEFDVLFDRMAPPLPPEGAFDARIHLDLLRDFRATTTMETRWDITVIQSDQRGEIGMRWSSEEVADVPGLLLMDVVTTSDTLSFEMRSQNHVLLDAEEALFIIRHRIEFPVTQRYTKGWNLIGSPQTTAFNPFQELPGAVNETLFGFNGAYTDETQLIAGQGYWIFTNELTEATFNPPFESSITRTVNTGWNLISGPWQDVEFDAVSDEDGVLVPGTLFAFSDGYTQTSLLEPGKGYWVLAAEDGTITMSLDLGLPPGKQLPEETLGEGLLAFEVSHGEGHSLSFLQGDLTDEVSQAAIRAFSMPPPPPSGAFDIRFEGNSRLARQAEATLKVISPVNDLIISLEETPWSEGQSLELGLLYGEESDERRIIVLHPGGSTTVPAVNEAGQVLTEIHTKAGGLVSIGDQAGSELPSELALKQNFPNPFNPSTTIAFELPTESDIRLAVYTMLGQQVALVAQEHRSAGIHTVQFDASSLSSGVYIYRLEAAGQVLTRKMTLIK